MPPRLRDIAARSGVSEATVSRVLNGRSGISRDTRRRVLEVADELGYRRVRSAADGGGTPVGVIVPELQNPVFAAFAQELCLHLAASGHIPLLGTQRLGAIGEDEWIQMLLDRGAEGLIVVSGMHADVETSIDRYQRLRDHNIPLLLVNGYREGIDALFLSTDDREAIVQSLSHLTSLGHRSIGLAVGPERYVPVIRKVKAFGDFSPSVGVIDSRFVHHSLFTIEGGHASGHVLLDQGVTAIVCASDVMALGVIRAASERKLSVPGDISVVGFDDSDFASFTSPALTTVRQPVADISREAMRLLSSEGSGATHNEYLFHPELMVRGSTAMSHDVRPDHLQARAT